ncbi:hypothetical protein EBQ90_11205 [bacterium]|nr:hypothetical protein [bacterium]
MKNTYLVLGELKRMDEKVARLQNELQQIPVEIQALQTQIDERLNQYQTVKTECDGIEKALRKAESDLKEKEDFLRKAESKMMEVKTNEEYQAALKENENHKTEKSGIEEQVLTLLSQMEGFRPKVKEAESTFKVKEAELKASQKRLEEEGKSLQRAFEELLEKRKSVASQLDPETKALYEKAVLAVKGVAIAGIDKGLCCGCNVRIRPQLYNEVLGLKSVHRCPNCGRLLIAPES